MQTYFPKKLLIISGLFIVLSVVIFLTLYFKIKSNTQVSEQASKEWQIESYRREKLDSLDGLVKKIQKEKIELDGHFVQSSDVVLFLDTIDVLSSKAQVEKTTVSTIDVLADKSALVIEVRSTGEFTSLYKFLELLENSPYEISFSSVNFRTDGVPESATKKVAPVWNTTFKIKLTSFIQ